MLRLAKQKINFNSIMKSHYITELFLNILLRITKIAFKYKIRVFAAWLTLILSTLAQITIPWLLGTTIDQAILGAGNTELITLGVLVLVFMGVRGIMQYVNMYLAELVSQKVAYEFRNSLYDKLQRLSFAFHDRAHTGDLMSRATVDVEAVRMFIGMVLVRSGQIVLLVLSAGIIMLILDWKLALISLSFVPIIGFRAVGISKKLRLIWRKAQDQMGIMTTILQENLSGIRVVKAFGADRHEIRKFEHQIQNVKQITLEAQRTQTRNTAFMQTVFWASTGILLWAGGTAIIDGRLSVGELAQFIFYSSLLVQPVRQLGMIVNNIARTISAGERLFEVLDAKSPVTERVNSSAIKNVKGSFCFENVTFSYINQPAISNVSFEAKPGEVIAIMGAAGSGKTTIASLLPRFYDVDDGVITIDGFDIRNVSLASLRETVGVVQQDVFLFSASIRENIKYGFEHASEELVIQAAKSAQIDSEIESLPDGYDTIIGERGMTLSGGQRQRLSIARTLLIDPPILVLDDSTSSVDAATETKIQAAMVQVMKNRTTLIVAHRLSSIQHADKVIILEKGKIIETGNPRELLEQEGNFSKIASMQQSLLSTKTPTRGQN